MAAGLSATSALAGFGKAEQYARGFLDDHALTQALDSRRALTMARTLLQVAGQSLIATLGLIGFLLFAVTTLGAVACLLIKIAKPDLAALWPDAERLGNWAYPILIAVVAIDDWLARFSLVLALKGLKVRSDRE